MRSPVGEETRRKVGSVPASSQLHDNYILRDLIPLEFMRR